MRRGLNVSDASSLGNGRLLVEVFSRRDLCLFTRRYISAAVDFAVHGARFRISYRIAPAFYVPCFIASPPNQEARWRCLFPVYSRTCGPVD